MYFEAEQAISRGDTWHEGAGHVAPDLGTLGTRVAKCQATRMHDVSGWCMSWHW